MGIDPQPNSRADAVPGRPPPLAPVHAVFSVSSFRAANVRGKLKILDGLSSRDRKQVFPELLQLLDTETHPAILASLLKAGTGIFDESHFPRLQKLLKNSSTSVRRAVLEIVVPLRPAILTDLLPRLLVSDDPRQRSLAIRALARIDPTESVAHIDAVLLGSDARMKQSVLGGLVFLPFALVKESLLKYLACEESPVNQRKVGNLFLINPDPEIPFRLWELSEGSTGDKSAFIKDLVQGTCRSLRTSGILSEEWDQYRKKLQEWVYRRSAVAFVHEAVLQCSEKEDDSLQLLFLTLSAALRRPFVRESFEYALTNWPLEDEARKFIQSLLSAVKPSEIASPGAPNSSLSRSNETTANILELPETDRIVRLSTMEQGSETDAAADILQIFSLPNPPDRLLRSAFRTATRLRLTGFADSAGGYLNRKDPGLIAAILEYLGWANFDQALPLLGKYLKHENPRIRSATVKILKREDPQQAISGVLHMLRSGTLQDRQAAFNCLIWFEFSLIREKLVGLLGEKPLPEMVRNVLYLFEANPDPENLYFLYVLARKLPESFHAEIGKTRFRCEETLRKYGRLVPADAENREADFASRFELETRHQQRVPPKYAVSRLSASPWEEVRFLLRTFWQDRKMTLAGVLTLMIFGSVFSLFPPAPSAPLSSPRNRAVLAEPFHLVGMVLRVNRDQGTFHVQTNDGTCFCLFLAECRDFVPLAGFPVSLQVIPYHLAADGTVFSRYEKMVY